MFATDRLDPMNSPPMKITLKEGSVPHALHVARTIPFAYREQVKSELDDMVDKNVIEKVGDVPTEWCHPMVVVQKPNGKVRITTDFGKLNKQVDRTVHNARTAFDIVSDRSSGAKYFTTLDATKGYWQMTLDPESRHLTTFITPWGKYRYLRAPMGFISTGDSYNYRGDEALEGIPRVKKIVDDILIEDSTLEEHIKQVRLVLERCRQHGITLSKSKFKFAKKEVQFAGFIISADKIGVDPAKIKAIGEFPTPSTRTDLRSFMGLANQLGSFCSTLSASATPLRELLKTKNEFRWLPEHDIAFRAM